MPQSASAFCAASAPAMATGAAAPARVKGVISVGWPNRAISMMPPAMGTSYCSGELRSEEHTSELQSLMRISYAVFCLKKKHTIIKPYKQMQNNHKHYKTTIM